MDRLSLRQDLLEFFLVGIGGRSNYSQTTVIVCAGAEQVLPLLLALPQLESAMHGRTVYPVPHAQVEPVAVSSTTPTGPQPSPTTHVFPSQLIDVLVAVRSA